MSDGIPTPKESGSLQRSTVFAALARGIRDAMAGWEVRYRGKGQRGLEELDIDHAKRCRDLKSQAEKLRAFFDSWELADPGPTERLAAVMRLRDLETVTKPYMPKF